MFKTILGSAQVNLGKFGTKHRNQHTITCQVLAELNKKWSCLILIKLYLLPTLPNWLKLVYGPAQTSQEGIECTKAKE